VHHARERSRHEVPGLHGSEPVRQAAGGPTGPPRDRPGRGSQAERPGKRTGSAECSANDSRAKKRPPAVPGGGTVFMATLDTTSATA
jgi:hypothetical protein